MRKKKILIKVHFGGFYYFFNQSILQSFCTSVYAFYRTHARLIDLKYFLQTRKMGGYDGKSMG